VVTAGDWAALQSGSALIAHIAISSGLESGGPLVWGRHIGTDERRITDQLDARRG
jgi:hypothetical protein